MAPVKNDPIPDFFIVGAAKAGTTSLADYLSQHPAVYMSPVKEPHFFAKDIRLDELRPLLKKRLKQNEVKRVLESGGKEKIHRAYITDPATYAALFQFAKPGQLKGEASPSYLYSELAAKEIHHSNPSAKIIILLREPVSRAFSHYQMDLRIGYTKGSFEEALREDAAHKGKSWGSRSHYLELGLYSAQVKRYLDIFPKEQILILLYDDLQADAAGILSRTLHFLGLADNSASLDLSVKNPASVARLKMDLHSPLAEKLKRMMSGKLKTHLKKIFFKSPEQVKPEPETTAVLKAYFRKDILQLEQVTGINLDKWK